MGLESASFVGGLVSTNPTGTDPKSQGDDHIRLIKSALLNSFAGFTGAVLLTGTEAQGATANDYTVTVTPDPAAYVAGNVVLCKVTHANTGPATLQVNALGTKSLLGVDGLPLGSGDIESGSVVLAYYDGTNFLLLSGNDRAARDGETYAGTHDFTAGSALVPIQAQADNSTKAASTAYVDTGLGTKAPLDSPSLTGVPTAPTAAPGTNNTQIATTAFTVQQAFLAVLPDQAGNANKFITTDGTSASWAYIPSQYQFETCGGF